LFRACAQSYLQSGRLYRQPLIALGAYPATAAAESCAYDASTRAVTALLDPGGDATLVVVGGALHFGASPVDTLTGGFDNDVLEADDDEPDAQIHGGPGTDTAYIDAGVDPATIAVETVIPR